MPDNKGDGMKNVIRTAGAAAIVAAMAVPSAAEDVKVGLMLTLSGSAAALGNHARDGFQLAVKEMGGDPDAELAALGRVR